MSTKCFPHILHPHVCFYVYSPKDNIKLCDDLEIHYVQLPLIDDTLEVDIMDQFTQWLTFIKDVHDQGKHDMINELLSKGSVFKMAYDEYPKINEDELMRERLEARQKFIWDMNTARSNPIEEGLEIGRAEGILEGKDEGRAEVEQIASHKIALKMVAKSMDLATISELTGLSIEELKQLQ